MSYDSKMQGGKGLQSLLAWKQHLDLTHFRQAAFLRQEYPDSSSDLALILWEEAPGGIERGPRTIECHFSIRQAHPVMTSQVAWSSTKRKFESLLTRLLLPCDLPFSQTLSTPCQTSCGHTSCRLSRPSSLA